ncbi:MAG: Na+/H+ antiporter NhaC family protein [Oxalobacter sp.]|nr:Na+/H+ antiporter NhaC family protein [Oxalobacter sp.]
MPETKTPTTPPSGWALMPFAVLAVVYLLFSLVMGSLSKVPMTTAFIAASAAALLMNRKASLTDKTETFARGMGSQDIMIMCLVFILAGTFTASAKAAGGVDAAVNITLHLIPTEYLIAGLFGVSALISLAVGTSCGTIAAIVPIAASLAQAVHADLPLAVGAAVGGAMFGDNLSIISDTTIAATRTQGASMRDKMIGNLKIVVIPALACLVLYLLPAFSAGTIPPELTPIGMDDILKTMPYILLLVLGTLGVNVIVLLLAGTVLNTAIGISLDIVDGAAVLASLGQGAISMAETLIVALLAGGLLALTRFNGGIDFLLERAGHWVKGQRSCEAALCFLVGTINLFTANNTVAIITAGPVAKEMAQCQHITPQRAACLLDTTSCVVQGMIPYGAQILIAASLTASLGLSPIDIITGLFYPPLMALGLAASILLKRQTDTAPVVR